MCMVVGGLCIPKRGHSIQKYCRRGVNRFFKHRDYLIFSKVGLQKVAKGPQVFDFI